MKGMSRGHTASWDEAYYRYGRQEGISHPGPVLLSKFLNFCWSWWAHLCFKIMIFSPFHKECGGRSPKSATFETMRCLWARKGRVGSRALKKKEKLVLFGKQEHKNLSRPQPWKLFQNMTQSKKNTTKTCRNHTRITSSSPENYKGGLHI